MDYLTVIGLSFDFDCSDPLVDYSYMLRIAGGGAAFGYVR